MTYDDRNADVISGLDEATQHKAWQAIDELDFLGEDVLFDSGLRSLDEQWELWLQGRDPKHPGPRVTNARPGESFHNFGVAIDIVPVGPLGVPLAKRNRLEWAAHGRYDTIARTLQGIGFQWGYQMWGFDKPHFQYTSVLAGEEIKQGVVSTVDGFLSLRDVRGGCRPSAMRARDERRAAILERIDIAEKARPKSYITARRRKRIERYLAGAYKRLEQIR